MELLRRLIHGPDEWIMTKSGTRFYFQRPTPEMVNIYDIAFALAGINRFTGHTRVTVAQHSVVGSYQVPPWFALEFLMHDAGEAYINDVNRPLKNVLGRKYRRIADRINRVIRAKYGLPLTKSDPVHLVDRRMCLTENRDHMSNQGIDWKGYRHVEPFHSITIQAWTAEYAEQAFMRRFHELTTSH